MGAHDAGKGVAVGDGDGFEPERLSCRDELLGVRAAAQEREVGGDVELGVAGHGSAVIPAKAGIQLYRTRSLLPGSPVKPGDDDKDHHPNTPCRYQAGKPAAPS